MRLHPYFSSTLAALALATTPATADVVELIATKDAAIYEESDTRANGAGRYLFSGNTDNANTRRSPVAFNLSSIPPGSTIDSVTLTLYMSRTQAGTRTTNLHRILADWTEGPSNPGGQEGQGDPAELNDVTWRYRSYNPSNPPASPQWSSLGGDYVSGASAGTPVSGTGFYNWTSAQMADDVQGWLDVPTTNFGWLVRDSNESGSKTAKRFNSRQDNDATRRPKLTVNFTPPSLTGACCFPGETCQDLGVSDCNNAGGTFQGDGTDCVTTTCVDPVGACCDPNPPWDCNEVSEFSCSQQGGTYQGDGEQCSLIQCQVVLEPFVDPLPIPGAAPPVSGTSGGAATYHIIMQELQQQLHTDLPPTTVWGYGAAPDPFDPAVTYASYPGPTIEATTGQPVTMRYFNELRDTALPGSPPPYRTDHYLPVPGTSPPGCIHGADGTPKTVVHLHGGHVEASYDGYPEHTFLPGEEAANCVTSSFTSCVTDGDCPGPGECDGSGMSCTSDADCVGQGGDENCLLCEPGYYYPNSQLPSQLWFHDHALGQTRLNVMMGMAALYTIRDPFEQNLGLPDCSSPTECYEIPLVIQDRDFNADGTLKYPDVWLENFFGDTILVNGKVWPYLDVAQGKYRFRLVNGSNSRRYTLRFERQDNPAALPFHTIGADGGLLPAPVALTQVTLGPAERQDVIVDFQQLPAGTEVILTNSDDAPVTGVIPNVMKFIVQAQSGFTGPVPAVLRPMEVLDPDDAIRTRQFLLRKGIDDCTGQRWEIKSLSADNVEVGARWDDITEFPQLGTTEIWEFANPTVVPHPMHMHLVFFQILNRQPFEIVDDEIIPIGSPTPPAPYEAGWKDTARTEPGELLRVIARFEDFEGKYAYHCHILEHEDHEMMRQFVTIGGVSLSMDADRIYWTEIPGATGYDVVRGDLATLRDTDGKFSLATEACILNGQPTTSVSHEGGPALGPGQGFWYLSRTRDAVGRGTYDSGFSTQIDRRDSEIGASGNDCP